MFEIIKNLLGGKRIREWQELWDMRSAGISAMLGCQPEDGLYHATVPLYRGGGADVIVFRDYVPGYTYVTCDLAGDATQQPNALGSYELMLCTREREEWAPFLISALARYTFEAVLNPDETMDIASSLPNDSNLDALFFIHPELKMTNFQIRDFQCGLLLCIGITRSELQYHSEKGPKCLLEKLCEAGVYPYTDLKRQSVVN